MNNKERGRNRVLTKPDQALTKLVIEIARYMEEFRSQERSAAIRAGKARAKARRALEASATSKVHHDRA